MNVQHHYVNFLGPYKTDDALEQQVQTLPLVADSLFLARLAVERSFPLGDDFPLPHTFRVVDLATVGAWFSDIGTRNDARQEAAVSYAISLCEAERGARASARRRQRLSRAENELIERLTVRAHSEWELLASVLGKKRSVTGQQIEFVTRKLFGGASLNRSRLSAIAI